MITKARPVAGRLARSMSFQPPKGTDDLTAPESNRWRRVLTLWDEWSERYGYPLVMTPVFEATELFARGVGDSTEVVTKQMYSFEDRGGRSLTLRPEGTAAVVRAYLNSGSRGAWKGAYSGPFFRYERPQAGRRRQFHQLGAEYLDVEAPGADLEIIELAQRFLTASGVPSLRLALNSLGDPNCRPAYVDALRAYLREREGDLTPGGAGLIDRNPLRVLDSKADGHKLLDAPRTLDYLCGPCASHYEAVLSGLDRLGIEYVRDDTLVRGLDYYVRTTFEWIGGELESAQNAVGGGGRYDGLAEAIGGRRTPGVGFALGMDRIISSAAHQETPALDAYLVSEVGADEALTVASRLRDQGLRIDFDAEGRSVKAQFKTARNAGDVVLVWRGPGRLVDVQASGERVELPIEEVANWFARR